MTNLLIISHSNNHWPTPEKNSSAIMLMVFPFISRFSLHFVLFWPMVRNSIRVLDIKLATKFSQHFVSILICGVPA